MEVIVGKAKLQGRGSAAQGASFSPGGQIVTFEVERKIIEIKSKSLFPLNDGDIVSAAGKMKNGILHARAVKNSENGVIGKAYATHLGASLAMGIGISTPFVLMALFMPWVLKPFFLAIPFMVFMDRFRTSQAVKAVKNTIINYSNEGEQK